ncbi:MAG: DNA recombination protein RmuC [Muribaculaceae bacterium]
MTSTIILLSIISIATLAVAIWLTRSLRGSQETIQSLSTDISTKQTEIASLIAQIAELKTKNEKNDNFVQSLNSELSIVKIENGKLSERIRITDEEKIRLQQESQSQFKLLANEIFEDKSKKFKETSEARLAEILNPLKENIETFKKTISDGYTAEAKERFSLQEKIKELMELNNTIGKEAKDLTLALKGNSKMQGDWGEMILENILEKSGLTRDQEFFIQATTDDNGNVIRNEEGGALRPDVIVKFPGDKRIVIDSKVSLKAYVSFMNAETPESQNLYIKQHLLSIRSHINELKNKKYQDFVGGKTDFVMMFIPNEAAYITAMQNDQDLWQDAYDSRVVIISPAHLISVLKLVNQLWSHDKQTRNAIIIAEESGKLYDKFAGFVNDMNKIEKSLNQTHSAYNDAMNKLSSGTGNLINRAEKLKELGAKASKSLASPTTE